MNQAIALGSAALASLRPGFFIFKIGAKVAWLMVHACKINIWEAEARDS
jgi:hypothetical protein